MGSVYMWCDSETVWPLMRHEDEQAAKLTVDQVRKVWMSFAAELRPEVKSASEVLQGNKPTAVQYEWIITITQQHLFGVRPCVWGIPLSFFFSHWPEFVKMNLHLHIPVWHANHAVTPINRWVWELMWEKVQWGVARPPSHRQLMQPGWRQLWLILKNS